MEKIAHAPHGDWTDRDLGGDSVWRYYHDGHEAFTAMARDGGIHCGSTNSWKKHGRTLLGDERSKYKLTPTRNTAVALENMPSSTSRIAWGTT